MWPGCLEKAPALLASAMNSNYDAAKHETTQKDLASHDTSDLFQNRETSSRYSMMFCSKGVYTKSESEIGIWSRK
jgi:hypothetical protein